MTRGDIIQKLKEAAPIITHVTGTMDMGFEFSAVVPDGVIYAEPGMLLSYSDGHWPRALCEETINQEYENLLATFLLDEEWIVTSWNELSDEELEQWLEDINNAQSSDKEE